MCERRLRMWLPAVERRLSSAVHRIEILGPAPAPLEKLKNNYRWQVLMKGADLEELHLICRQVEETQAGNAAGRQSYRHRCRSGKHDVMSVADKPFDSAEQWPQRLETFVHLHAEYLGETVEDDDGVAVGIKHSCVPNPLEHAVVDMFYIEVVIFDPVQ